MNKRQMKGPSHEKNKYLDQCTAFISNLDLEASWPPFTPCVWIFVALPKQKHIHIQAVQYTSVISEPMMQWLLISTGKLWTSTWFLQWCWWSHSYSNIEGQVHWKIKGLSLSLSLSHTHTHTHTPLFWLFLSPLCMSHVNENSTGQLSCYIHFHLALKFIVVVFYIWWQETGIWNFLDTLYRSMFQVLWTISVCLVAKK